MTTETDLVILGGGTGGYVAAIRAAQKGLKVTIVEQAKLGGTCLHRGCIPTKALLRSAEVLDTVKAAAEFGIEGSGHGTANFAKIQARKAGIVAQLEQGVISLCQQHKITVLAGTGTVLGPSIFSPVSGAVAVTFNDPSQEEVILVPKNVIIATGARPRTLPHLPLDEQQILSSDGMLALDVLPKSLAIVGAGVIGVEWASLLNSFGVAVTLIESQERVLINESATISRELQQHLEAKGIRILLNSQVTGAQQRQQDVTLNLGAEGDLVVEKVMVAIGRQPNVESLGLQNTSVTFDARGIKVNEHYQTKEGHIYAIGDCIDTLQLAHVAMKEGELAVSHLLGETVSPLNYRNIPRGVYTTPEVASVGYTKETLPAEMKVQIGTFHFANSGKALVYGAGNGFVEVIRDLATDDLVGVSIIGPQATDLITEASMAIYLDATPLELGESIHPHPTLSEVIQEAALDSYGSAIHK